MLTFVTMHSKILFKEVLKLEKIMSKSKSKRTEYNKIYQQKDRERTNYLNDRSKSRSFIKNKATLEDLEELKELIRLKELELKK